jgi:hypothetical protein
VSAFGDRLFAIVSAQRNLLFIQGELAELTYQAFTQYSGWIAAGEAETIDISFPIGYLADKTTINNTRTFEKDELVSRYQHLGLTQLPINAIYQLITTIESLLGAIIREVLNEFPSKIPSKRKVDAEIILSSDSIDALKNRIIDSILNELNYKSPREFAVEFNHLIGINLLEKPVFHRYIEFKATRDIYIHNSGVANEIYLAKAETLARVRNGEHLPVTIQYFLESYEYSLQLTEVLEQELHKIWPSQDFVEFRKNNSIQQQQEEAVEKAIETVQELTHAEEVAIPKLKPPVFKRPKKKGDG